MKGFTHTKHCTKSTTTTLRTCILHRQSKTAIHIKRLIYMTYIRPIWQYACSIWWNSASNTHQNRILRMVINAPWYVRNTTIHKDMKIPFVTQTLHNTYLRHHTTLIIHPNPLISNIPQHMQPDRRLKRKRHTDIPHTTLEGKLSQDTPDCHLPHT
jgi:hypothetical protein